MSASAPIPGPVSDRSRVRDPAHPVDDSRVRIDRSPGSGSISVESVYNDDRSFITHRIDDSNGDDHTDRCGGFHSVGSWFQVEDLEDPFGPVYDDPAGTRLNRWRRLKKVQTGRTQGQVGSKKRVRRYDRRRRCEAILDEFAPLVREQAVDRTVSTRMRGFSRHYQGADGACLGFAMLSLFDDVDEALESSEFELVQKQCSSLGIDPEKLIRYTFREFG